MRASFVAGCVCALLWTGAASADTPQAARTSNDSITLNDGSVLRGTLIEIVKGDHVSLVLSDSQKTARVRWDAIVKAERGGVRIDLANVVAPPAPTPIAATPVPEKVVPKVTVHIHATSTVDLQLSDEQTLQWRTVCSTPCDVELPIGRLYRINGSGVRQTRPFALRGTPGGKQFLDVEAASSAGYAAGMVMTSLGSPVVLVGGIVVVVRVANGDTDGIQGSLIATGIGLALFVPGLYLAVNNDSTTVGQSRAGTSATAVPRWTPSTLASTRLPTWRVMDGPTAPAAPSISLFRGTF